MSLKKWYIVANIRLSEQSYKIFMASDIDFYNIFNESFVSNGNRIDTEITTANDFGTAHSATDFFAGLIIDAKLDLKHNLLHIAYNKRSSCLEFAYRSETNESSIRKLYSVLAVILSAAQHADGNAESVCILSSTALDNIKAYFLLSKSSVVSLPKDLIPRTVPSDIALLYHNATNDISVNLFTSRSTDSDILKKFYSRVDDMLSIGTDKIIDRASMERLEILTPDALYFTDSINVLTRYGEVVNGADPHTFSSLGGYYSKDNKNVFYATEIIADADHNSFIRIGTDYAKDKNFAYYQGKVFTKISESFKICRPSEGYATDAENVYHNGKLIEGSDGKTFHTVGEVLSLEGTYFGVDKNHVYLNGKAVNYIDPPTFEHVAGQFFKDANNVYIYSTILPNCSPKNIKVLNRFYIIDDSKTVFFVIGRQSHTIAGVDIKTARVSGYFLADNESVFFKGKKVHALLGCDTDISDQFGDGYIYDKKSVLYFDKPVFANRASFTALGYGYAKDNKSVFFRDIKIEDVDLETFSPISYGYASDKNAVYTCDMREPIMTQENASQIAGNYSKDHYDIYYKKRKIEQADYDSFNVISDSKHPNTIEDSSLINTLSADRELQYKFITNYAFDKNNVYFKDKIIRGADLQTFKVFDQPQIYRLQTRARYIRVYSKDANHIYFKNEPIKMADVNSFAPFKIENIWRDDQYLYLDGEVLTYIDLATYEHLEHSFYKDKKSIYYEIDPIDQLSVDSLKVLHRNYIRDAKEICYINRVDSRYLVRNIFEAEVSSFNIMSSNDEFSFDRNKLFFMGKQIADITISDVEFLHGRYFKTDYDLYYGNKRVPVRSIDNVSLLPDDYLTDQHSSYYRYNALNTTKAVTVLGNGYATDGSRYWKNGTEIEDVDNDPYLQFVNMNL